MAEGYCTNNIPLQSCVRTSSVDIEDSFEKELRGRPLTRRMDTWHGSPRDQNDVTEGPFGYIGGVKGIYGAVDTYSIIGSTGTYGYDPNGNDTSGVIENKDLSRSYKDVSARKRLSCDQEQGLLTRSLSDDVNEFKYMIYGDNEKLSETAPLLSDGRKVIKYFDQTDVSSNPSLLSDNVKNTKKHKNYPELFKSYWAKVPWSKLKHLKVLCLTIVVVASTIIYASAPYLEYKWSQISVSQSQPHTYIKDNSKLGYSIVKIYIRGHFLFKQPTSETGNVVITVKNAVTNDTKSWALVAPPLEEFFEVEEEIYDADFEFSDGIIPDQYYVKLEGNFPYSVPISISINLLPSKVKSSVIYAALILFFVYFLIIFELVHRTVAAMIGSLMALAALAQLNEKPDLITIVGWLDFETLALLFGMMVIVSILTDTGFFDWIALMAYKVAKGKTWPLITTLCAFAAVFSAFLDNVTTILLLAPVTIRLCEVIDIDPIHVLIAEVMFSNIGGAATAIGDPPNVIILSNRDIIDAGIDFGTFTLHMTLGALLAVVAGYALIRFIYRKKELLRTSDPPEVTELKQEMKVWQRACNKITVATREASTVKALLMQKVVGLDFKIKCALYEHRQSSARGFKIQVKELEKIYFIKDKLLLAQCLTVLFIVILMFILSAFLSSFKLSIGWIPIMGALWLLVMSDVTDLEAILHRIEWGTLIFFAALFVLMEALTQLDLIEFLTEQTTNVIKDIGEESRLAVSIIIILWLSASVSSFIDNIPYTTAMLPVIVKLSGDVDLNLPLQPLVWALAFGACLGGNGTLVGASCNVVCAGIAENHGHEFTFGQFFRVGFPMMIVTTFVIMLYLLTVHVALGWN